MRKQELIHMHSLLAEVASNYETEHAVDLTEYRSLGTLPTSINQSKTAHKEAVFELSRSVSQSVREEHDLGQPRFQSTRQAS